MGRRPPSVQTWPKDRASWVRTSPTSAIPTKFGAFIDDPAQPFTVELEVVTTGGRRPEVTEMTLGVRNLSTAGVPISTENLRHVHVAAALTLALTGATEKVIDNGDGTFTLPDDTTGTSWPADHVTRPVRGTTMSPEFLQIVATTYRAAVASGSRSPVGDLSIQLGTSRSTAGRWVVAARKAGLLGKAIGRTAGEDLPARRRKRTT
jgi:hypothetical protein